MMIWRCIVEKRLNLYDYFATKEEKCSEMVLTFSPVITVGRGYNAKHLKENGVVVHTVRPEWLELGLTQAQTFTGNIVRNYDRERCICNIIKNKNKMDIQVFQMALTSYFSDSDKNIHNLMEYAGIMGVSDKVRQYTEVLL